MEKVRINTSQPYDVLIGAGILSHLSELLSGLDQKPDKIAIITDTNVGPLYEQTVADSLAGSGYEIYNYTFNAGESAKCIENAMEIITWLVEKGFTRTDMLLALGGGVCGDLTGFVASIYLRGIAFVQIPTTFLSMIDSSVGGKTGINIKEGKNLVGAFWQPKLVVCDTSTLSTLSQEEYSSGIGEGIKYGCIWDKSLFTVFKNKSWLENSVEQVISRCVKIKAEVVAEDEREKGIRTILNFGHTVGHAVEKLSGYTIPHGYGVAIGMCIAAKMGENLGITPKGTAQQISETLSLYGLPTQTGYSAESLAKATLGDKKRSGNDIKFVMLSDIGKSVIEDIPVTKIRSLIEEADRGYHS